MEVNIRLHKMKEVFLLTIVCCSCFVIKSFILIWMAMIGKFSTTVTIRWWILFSYFGGLEIFLIVLILYFYRKFPAQKLSYYSAVKTNELTAELV